MSARAILKGEPGEKRFVCSECGEVFLNYEDRGPIENLSFHCPGCGVEFKGAGG